ncbi:MAG: hypothetical protein ACI82I_002222 [Gammaproteobacteria bacterium]|jgi:hypothetical protein
MFGHAADAAFVRSHSSVFFALQRVSPEQSFESVFRHKSKTVFSLRREQTCATWTKDELAAVAPTTGMAIAVFLPCRLLLYKIIKFQ